MTTGTEAVDRHLAALDHPRKPEIETLRALVLRAHPALTERVKWNAPSFCAGGDDRVTMRLHPGPRVQLVFHRGARAKASDGFHFDDPTGLLEWAAPDRAILSVADAAALARHADAITALVHAWIEHTTEAR